MKPFDTPHTPAACAKMSERTPIVVTDANSFGLERAHLPTPVDLIGHLKPLSAVGRRNRIRRTSFKMKYDKTVDENTKEEAAKLVAITKAHYSPSKEVLVGQFIEDTIAMGLSTDNTKEMMIAELGKDL